MYYKAVVTLAQESMDAEGCTGDWQDLGEINRYTAPSIRELFDKIARQFDLNIFETFENRLDGHVEVNDHHGHRLETYSIYITAVEETEIFETTLNGFLKEYTK